VGLAGSGGFAGTCGLEKVSQVKLSSEQCIELVRSNLIESGMHLDEFETACPIPYTRPGYTRRAVAEGETTLTTVTVDGQPAWTLGWRRTNDGGFWIDLCQSIQRGFDFRHALQAAEHLARQSGAHYLRFATHRAGMARLCRSVGYTAEAVVLSKPLPPSQ
jgi:hypothetical protein